MPAQPASSNFSSLIGSGLMLAGLIRDSDACAAVGAALCPAQGGLVIFLHGELGAGKSTLARGLLRQLGVEGSIRSPTYTLLEHYEVGARAAVHLDLYRIADASELEYLGVRDLGHDQEIWLVEWAERAKRGLPEPDLEIFLEHAELGRRIQIRVCSQRVDSRLPNARAALEAIMKNSV